MIETERLADNPELLEIVNMAQAQAVADGGIPFTMDLDHCEAVATDEMDAVIVYSLPGFHQSMTGKEEGYVWFWWRKDRRCGDDVMDQLVGVMMEIQREHGAKTVAVGINGTNTRSLNLAERTGFRPFVTYLEKEIA